MSRRVVLGGSAAILASGVALAGSKDKHDHSMHAPKHPDAQHAAQHCSEKANACLAHCLVTFQEGDTSLADCAVKVNETISLCDALAAQMGSNSPYVAKMVDVCREACADCEKECRKHEEKHQECKICADSCAELLAATEHF